MSVHAAFSVYNFGFHSVEISELTKNHRGPVSPVSTCGDGSGDVWEARERVTYSRGQAAGSARHMGPERKRIPKICLLLSSH